MGQTHHQQSILKKPQEYKELQPIDEQAGIYLNLRNNKMYIKNHIMVGTITDVQYESQIYLFRRINDSFVVSVDFCQVNRQQSCSSFSAIHYFIEKHEYTLFDKFQCSVNEGFRILIQVLKGFEILYQKFGYFTVNSRLVFFNRNNEAKVWINQNLKITKNVQNQNIPKSLMLQNKFIREIVHLFDFLRDRNNPMINYSKYLPKKFLNFRQTEEVFFKQSIEFQQTISQPKFEIIPKKQQPLFKIAQNLEKYAPRLQRVQSSLFAKKNIKQMENLHTIKQNQHEKTYLQLNNRVSYQTSPVNSPRYFNDSEVHHTSPINSPRQFIPPKGHHTSPISSPRESTRPEIHHNSPINSPRQFNSPEAHQTSAVSTPRYFTRPEVYQTSAVNTPRHFTSPEGHRQNKPQINFLYNESKKEVKIRQRQHRQLQNNKRPNHFEQKFTFAKNRMNFKDNPSQQIKETMPNSLRNSFVQQKSSLILPFMSNKSSPIKQSQISQDISDEGKKLTSFGKDMKRNHNLNVSLQGKQNLFYEQSVINVYTSNLEHSKETGLPNNSSNYRQKPNVKTFHLKSDFLPEVSEFSQPQRKQYQTHKRHKTDFKQKQMSSPSETKFSTQWHQLTKFNLNTIKSIHLLQQKDMDNEIIGDLKRLINKYLNHQ